MALDRRWAPRIYVESDTKAGALRLQPRSAIMMDSRADGQHAVLDLLRLLAIITSTSSSRCC